MVNNERNFLRVSADLFSNNRIYNNNNDKSETQKPAIQKTNQHPTAIVAPRGYQALTAFCI